MEDYFYFWKHFSPFSNFNTSTPFVYKGITFNSSEQAFMYMKAIKFNDIKSANKIIAEKNPHLVKNLGRAVKNYNEDIWVANREAIMKDILKIKFLVPYYRNHLLETGDLELVEASPFDTIWGIGLAESDLRAKNKNTWRGQNLLGKVLTEIKQDIQGKNHLIK